ncbi:MAG: DUF4124 domain-containing protein [Deltaproteobacteria bacterium]|nr:DUF4124 domain-containing protein [Deltaproteobacteria bacterium]
MKRMTIGMVAAVLLLSASMAFAELYEWKDKDGIVHLTDSIQNVPEEYRDRVKVHSSTPKERVETQEPAPTQPSDGPGAEQVPSDLYGDQPLEWWANAISSKKAEINALESSMNSKKQLISVFESGRRFGQVFEQKDVDTYERYKQELSADEEKLSGLKEDLGDLRRKATRAGVPREVRE